MRTTTESRTWKASKSGRGIQHSTARNGFGCSRSSWETPPDCGTLESSGSLGRESRKGEPSFHVQCQGRDIGSLPTANAFLKRSCILCLLKLSMNGLGRRRKGASEHRPCRRQAVVDGQRTSISRRVRRAGDESKHCLPPCSWRKPSTLDRL